MLSTHITLDLELFKEDTLDVDIKLFDSFMGSGYNLYKNFTITGGVASFDLFLPEISIGMISIRNKSKVISNSGAVVFSGDTLYVKPESFKTVLLVKGGENEFMQENFNLPFNLPSRITNSKSFKPKMVQRTYDLQIPEDPMLQAIYQEYLRNVLLTVKQYPNSLHILRLLNKNAGNITLKTLDSAVMLFNESIINTVSGRRLKTIVANGKWLINAPDLTLVNLQNIIGKQNSLASLMDSSKYTLIDFWASWCAPCREFNRKLVQKYDSLNLNTIQIISISIDEDVQKWKTALNIDNLRWLNYIDPSKKGFEGDLSKLFNIQFIPQSYLFNKKGEIVNMNVSIEELLKLKNN